MKMDLSLKQMRLIKEKTQDEMAEKLGIEIPQSVMDRADYIIENGETVAVEK